MTETLEARWRRIWEENGASLSRVAAGYACNATEREDLIQECGLALWRALPGFRGECSEKTFVFRIVHNLGINLTMRRKPTEAIPTLVDPNANQEKLMDEQRRRFRLLNAIRRLPLAYQQVVGLALEELCHQEIAEVLGISVNNVAVRLSRAKDALRLEMEKE